MPAVSVPLGPADHIPGGFKVIDATGQAVAYYGRETREQADIAKVLEARL